MSDSVVASSRLADSCWALTRAGELSLCRLSSSGRNWVNVALTAYPRLSIDLRSSNAELSPRDQAAPELYQ